jgi:hypothetical protein
MTTVVMIVHDPLIRDLGVGGWSVGEGVSGEEWGTRRATGFTTVEQFELRRCC